MNNDNDRVSLAQAIKDIQDNIVAHLESIKLTAKLTRAKYNALIAEGFTKEEALILCAKV